MCAERSALTRRRSFSLGASRVERHAGPAVFSVAWHAACLITAGTAIRDLEPSLQQSGEFLLEARLVREKAASFVVRWARRFLSAPASGGPLADQAGRRTRRGNRIYFFAPASAAARTLSAANEKCIWTIAHAPPAGPWSAPQRIQIADGLPDDRPIPARIRLRPGPRCQPASITVTPTHVIARRMSPPALRPVAFAAGYASDRREAVGGPVSAYRGWSRHCGPSPGPCVSGCSTVTLITAVSPTLTRPA